MALSGREKATIFLSLLGAEVSARILRLLPDEMADLIAAGVNHLPSPSPDAIAAVLEDFRKFVLPPSSAASPLTLNTSMQNQEQPQEQPLEEEQEIEENAGLKSFSSPEEAILSAPARSIAAVLVYERPQVSAMILSLFSYNKALDVLMNLSTQRAKIEELMRNRLENKFTPKIKDLVIAQIAEKIK